MITSMTSKQVHFLYAGEEDCKVPDDVTHIKVDAIEIKESAFANLRKLTAVEISSSGCIGDEAFWDTTKLRSVALPSSLKIVGKWSFGNCSKLHPPNLPEGLESIGDSAFCGCNFRNMRLPPSIMELHKGTFEFCCKLLSLELPDGIQVIHDYALNGCERLRNLAFPSSISRSSSTTTTASLEYGNVLHGCKDLRQVYSNDNDLVDALKHRFAGFPIHALCYYQSYRSSPCAETTIDYLKQQLESSKSYVEGHQDSFGMTPLHILALSAKPNIEMMRVILKKWPDLLIAKDKWGFLAIYYACECDAPMEIIGLFVDVHMAFFPDLKLDWTKMVKTSRMDLAQLLLASSLVFANLPSRITRKSE